MVVDNKTAPSSFNLYFEDGERFKELVKKGRALADENGVNDDETSQPLISFECEDLHCEEYYFDQNNGKFTINFNFNGASDSAYMELELSDDVLIDILSYAIKKQNKLKLALESLK